MERSWDQGSGRGARGAGWGRATDLFQRSVPLRARREGASLKHRPRRAEVSGTGLPQSASGDLAVKHWRASRQCHRSFAGPVSHTPRRTPVPRHTRRGFSLLETVLAAALGVVVVFGATAIIGVMGRTDRSLEVRTVSMMQMASLRLALQRSFSGLVTTTIEDAPGIAGTSIEVTDEEGATTRRSLSYAELVAIRSEVEAIPEVWQRDLPVEDLPRLILRQDRTPSYLGGPVSPTGTQYIQSFEVVVEEPPAGMGWPVDLDPFEAAELEESVAGYRGIFELREDDEDLGGWAMWWRPLRPDGTPYTLDTDRRHGINAIRLASGIESLTWNVFYRNERLNAYQASAADDLPAYVEIEVRALSGLYASWIFEVQWATGPEVDMPDLGGAAAPPTGQGGQGGDAGGEAG